jgi:hypothetical protein
MECARNIVAAKNSIQSDIVLFERCPGGHRNALIIESFQNRVQPHQKPVETLAAERCYQPLDVCQGIGRPIWDEDPPNVHLNPEPIIPDSESGRSAAIEFRPAFQGR